MKELTTEQQAAVDSTATTILLTACAGSGKSTTLVERIARTIESGVHPNRIIAVTYTIAAAHELDRKVCRRMVWVEATPRTSSLGYVGTLHGFCVRLLKQFGPQFGMPQRFGILSEQQTKDLIERTATEMRYKGSKVALADAVESFPRLKPRQLDKVQLVAAAFYGTLARHNLLTFDLVLIRGLELLRQMAGDVPTGWRYTHILWDEIQDSSDVDLAILDVLPCEEKFACGDFRQSIMGFRGANWEGCRTYFGEANWTQLNLTTNFRSDVVIVNAANRLMNGDLGPDMVSASRHNGTVGLAKYPTGEREIVGVADVILGVLKTRPETSVGVLLRTNALVALWKKGLEDMGLKVHSRAVTLPVDWQMVLTYLSLLNDPDNDWLAYETLVAFRGKEVADEIRGQALAKLTSINQVALGIPAEIQIEPALTKLATTASAEAMEALRKLVASAPPDLLIADLMLAAQRMVFPEKEQSGVSVTTMHSAKGLEYDMCVLPAFEGGIIPLRTADEAEEKRLAYVAVTRARHILQISYAEQRRNPFTKQYEPARPSRFVNMMAKQLEVAT